MTARVTGDTVRVEYAAPGSGPYRVHLALLGMGIETRVKAGENRGRTLAHEFVVLGTVTGALRRAGAAYGYRGRLPVAAAAHDKAGALAVWVTRGSETAPLQAVGGLLRR